MPQPNELRVMPGRVATLKSDLGITWSNDKEMEDDTKELNLIGALAVAAGVETADEDMAWEYCLDEYGRFYARGLLHGWKGRTRVFNNRRDVENEDWRQGYEDGIRAAFEAGLRADVPTFDWPKLLDATPPHDPEFFTAPVIREVALTRIRKANRTPAQQLELDAYRSEKRLRRRQSRQRGDQPTARRVEPIDEPR